MYCTGKPKSITTEKAHQNVIEKVVRYMKSNLVEFDVDLSLNALARQGCYSRSHIIAVFEEVTGTTPHHFLSSLRIEKAKQLLMTTSASVTVISQQVGYDSLGTFSRIFSDYVCLSPSEFRKTPCKMSSSELVDTVKRFIDQNRVSASDDVLRGHVQAPTAIQGIIFVGAFTRGVPQGRPESGTVLLQSGEFRIRMPKSAPFYLFTALVPYVAIEGSSLHMLQFEWVASLRIQEADTSHLNLTLRRTCYIDPPLVVSLAGLLKCPS